MSWYSEIVNWAKSLDQPWIEARKAGESFSSFAYRALQNHTFHQNFDLEQSIKEVLELQEYPHQINPNSKFGDPPITLYTAADKSFYLDLYIWTESQTSTHQHTFEGAFSVLAGQSIETEYSFVAEKDHDKSQWGKLLPKDLLHLKPGMVREIKFREKFIHRVLHISKPTISLVLRTNIRFTEEPQFNYDFGMLASPGFPPGEVVGKLRALNWYLKSGHTPTYKMVAPILAYAETWHALLNAPQAKTLLTKLSFMQNDFEILVGMGKQRLFHSIFAAITNEEERILLSAYEYFGPSWTNWVEKHLSLSPEMAKAKLVNSIKSLNWSDEGLVDSPLLKDLFQSGSRT